MISVPLPQPLLKYEDLTCNPVSAGRHLLPVGKSDEAITESGESWSPFNVNRWQTYSSTCTLKQKLVS